MHRLAAVTQLQLLHVATTEDTCRVPSTRVTDLTPDATLYCTRAPLCGRPQAKSRAVVEGTDGQASQTTIGKPTAHRPRKASPPGPSSGVQERVGERPCQHKQRDGGEQPFGLQAAPAGRILEVVLVDAQIQAKVAADGHTRGTHVGATQGAAVTVEQAETHGAHTPRGRMPKQRVRARPPFERPPHQRTRPDAPACPLHEPHARPESQHRRTARAAARPTHRMAPAPPSTPPHSCGAPPPPPPPPGRRSPPTRRHRRTRSSPQSRQRGRAWRSPPPSRRPPQRAPQRQRQTLGAPSGGRSGLPPAADRRTRAHTPIARHAASRASQYTKKTAGGG